MNIEKVAVLGAGVMGASIAAHISNAGIPVFLLDIVPKNTDNRNGIAETAIKKLLKAEPAAFMQKGNARLITPGNIEDHLGWLTEVDWVIEAVIEKPEIKKTLYRQLDTLCTPDTLISSNTSTLPLNLLTDGLPDTFKQRFMITHFFNPPRYMRLLEMVTGPLTRPALVDKVTHFADVKLGKSCVTCKDTPGFIGNRIGIFWLQYGLLKAIEMGLTIEEADAVMSIPFGIPKTGIFGLLDLVGLDLIPHILNGMKQALAKQDPFHRLSQTPELLEKMIAEGYTGRKGKGGFYRLQTKTGQRVKEAIDLQTGHYSPSHKPGLESIQILHEQGLQGFLSSTEKTAVYAWEVMANTLLYAARLVPEITDEFINIDIAMKRGFNWSYGPFELLDRIGVDWFVDRINATESDLPPLLRMGKPFYQNKDGKPFFLDISGNYRPVLRPKGQLLLADIKLQGPAVLENPSASLWDIGDGVACLEFHSKMNTLDMDTMTLIWQSIDRVKSDFSSLIIHNDAENFSAGANLNLLIQAIDQGLWNDVEALITRGQQTYSALKYAPFPVIGAPSGLALGGGCEILLHCDAIQAHAELYIGLVEVGAGLIPGWGGCKEFLHRCWQQPSRPGGPIPPVLKAFQTISMARVSKSAFDAKELLFLTETDAITMNKDRLLADAKTKALELAESYTPPEPCALPLPGKTARILLNMGIKTFRLLGKATAYDVEVGRQLAYVLSGGDSDLTEPLSEKDILALELEAFMHLVRQPGTQERLKHLIKTGKPLRN